MSLDGDHEAADRLRLSAARWGDGPVEYVFLHGGGQNAHTWDLVLTVLGASAIAVDLPGHGHSEWRPAGRYGPVDNAIAVQHAVAPLLERPVVLVGMSLGGLTAMAMAARRPDLVSRLVIVDVTPQVLDRVATMTSAQRGTTALTQGAEYFDDIEAMVEQAVSASPGRSVRAVRRGVVHNSRPTGDGRWRWRYDLAGMQGGSLGDVDSLWADVDQLAMPVLLVRGGASAFVADGDAEEFRRRCPQTRVEVVEDAGHSVQSDQPRRLAELISADAATPSA